MLFSFSLRDKTDTTDKVFRTRIFFHENGLEQKLLYPKHVEQIYVYFSVYNNHFYFYLS